METVVEPSAARAVRTRPAMPDPGSNLLTKSGPAMVIEPSSSTEMSRVTPVPRTTCMVPSPGLRAIELIPSAPAT